MIDKIINSRFFIIILFALVFFESKEFVFRSINKFYLFEIEKTAVTRGIITKAILQDGIGGRAYKCTFSYQTNGLLFKNSETVSVDSITNFNIGDSATVIYSVKHPSKGTLGNTNDLFWRLIASIAILIGTSYAAFALCQLIYLKIKNKRDILIIEK
jgi:hypothetical protein